MLLRSVKLGAGISMSFVIDESSFQFQGLSQTDVLRSLDHILDLVVTAQAENHQVFYTVHLSEFEVLPGITLFDLLAIGVAPIHLTREMNERLISILFSLPRLEDYYPDGIEDYVVLFDNQFELLAPTIASVHALKRIKPNEQFSFLVFKSGRKTGLVEISVLGNAHELWFVGCLNAYQNYFRSLIILHCDDESKLVQYCHSAFANLRFSTIAIHGVRDLDGRYRDLINDIVVHLSVLSDNGVDIFNMNWQEATARLGSAGIDATDENGKTKRNAALRAARTVNYEGQEITCWWHTKLSPQVNRIYFGLDFVKSSPAFILVGKIHSHL